VNAQTHPALERALHGPIYQLYTLYINLTPRSRRRFKLCGLRSLLYLGARLRDGSERFIDERGLWRRHRGRGICRQRWRTFDLARVVIVPSCLRTDDLASEDDDGGDESGLGPDASVSAGVRGRSYVVVNARGADAREDTDDGV
jgi:hypothetical protein